MPLSRRSCPELAYEATRRGIAVFMSASSLRRWPADDALKPWQHRSWIFIADPDFRAKAQRVLDLYARTWPDADEYVSAPRRPPPRARCHPALAPGQARAMRVHHTYGRGGALAYLAAYDVHASKTFSAAVRRPPASTRS